MYYTANNEPKYNTIIVKTTHNNIAIVIEPVTLTKYEIINVYKPTTNIATNKTNNPLKNFLLTSQKKTH